MVKKRRNGSAKNEWPADAVERRAVTDLLPYANNARTHSEHQIGQLAAAIQKWGWTNPVLIDETGMIIAGHGRVLAAQSLAIDEVPVMVAAGWSDAAKRAYVIADNKLAENAGWDDDLLRLELDGLDSIGEDLGALGFSEADLAQLQAQGGKFADPDAEWQGMPAFTQRDERAFRSIALHFKDQKAVDDFAKLIGQTITPKYRSLWFPPEKREEMADKAYTSEG
jgi:ParB-like chromosome segregation protein Spo0J